MGLTLNYIVQEKRSANLETAIAAIQNEHRERKDKCKEVNRASGNFK